MVKLLFFIEERRQNSPFQDLGIWLLAVTTPTYSYGLDIDLKEVTVPQF